MNPALIHNAYANSYPSQDRPFPNSSVVTNEYLERRDGISSNTINQSLALGAPNNVMDYSSNHSLQEQPYSSTNPQYLLSPPQTVVEASTVNNRSSSTYPYSTLPRSHSSNVSNFDWNTGTSTWPPNAHGMTPDMRHIRGPPVPHIPPPNQHPQYSYQRGVPIPMDPPNYRPSYLQGDAFNRPFSREMPIPVPTVFPNSFPPMQPTTSTRDAPKGPPFGATKELHRLVNARGQMLSPAITANITKNFFEADNKWTCYRRNYFTVVCSFTFKMYVLDSQIYLQRNTGSSHSELVSQWAISLSAITAAGSNGESEPRGLVQHTPKRNKASETIPSRHLIAPGPPPHLNTSLGLPHSNFLPSASHVSPFLPNTLDPYGHPHAQSAPISYTFERIQFHKATANNGKRRAQQQYYHVVANLEANVGRPGGQEDWVIVATTQSKEIVVRGRSPGHYKDNLRPGSQDSMDSDGHAGHGGDGGHSTYVMSTSGSSHAVDMSWSAPSNPMHQNAHYGSSYIQRADHTPYSSVSPESSSTQDSSNGPSPRAAAINTPGSSASINRILLSPVMNRLNGEAIEYQRSRKRQYDDDGPDGARPCYPNAFDHGYRINSSYDFPATGSPQGLYDSS